MPGVRPATLEQALALSGRAPVTTFFGRLRPGVLAVDIDMARGRPVVAELVAWCVEQDLWHVVRDSGRPGHAHVLIVAGAHTAALVAHCAKLRAAYGVSRSRIDVRDTLRPLSAPHRTGATPPLPRGLPTAARALPAALRPLPAADQPPPARRVVPLAPRPLPRAIRRRDLPPDWADYLTDGIPPAQVASWSDASRSAVESTATWQMAVAGWTADQAWLAIGQAHPRAFSKARQRGHRWWAAAVWNPAVEALAAAPPPAAPRRAAEDPQLGQLIIELRAAWADCWATRYPDPRRHTLRRVLDVLLDRMVRTASARVPCPQRDLVLDTGLSRPTVAAALEQLHTDGWIVLERSFDPGSGQPDGLSHHASLPERAPASTVQGGGPSSSLPPSPFTPQPVCSPTTLRTAALLGPRLWHLYLALLTSAAPISPPDVAHPAGWTASPTAAGLSSRSARTLTNGLARLAAAGLATCDEHGQWTAFDLEQVSEETRAAAADADQRRRTEVDNERAAYAKVRVGHGRWHRQREAARHRGAVARQLGARRWWDALDPGEREHRRAAWAAHYRALTPAEQHRVKTRLAEQRQTARGLTEDQLHQAWTASIPEPEYQARAAERSRWYQSLDLASQRALVTGWDAHRDRWGIQRRPHSSTPLLDLAQPAEAAAIGLLAELVGARPHQMTAYLEESA